ncbi:group 1 glycosyl transferase [Chitinophagaceae bacterium IBVUCB1]|nr:group 1 glycosyl transferase [Chitinophagaceae bacterium IBVUCB1]
MKKPKILFMVPYPIGNAPSQRFRVELFEPYLKEAGFSYEIAPFMDATTWKHLYKQGSLLQKAWGIAKGYLKRIKNVLIDVHGYDYIFVHREAAPLGPPVFEWIIARLWGKKMIFDFDDAIWIPNTSNENSIAARLKCFWKTKHIIKWSYKIAAGNDYLSKYALQYNSEVVLMPTCVDMERMHNGTKAHTNHKPIVGWTGSHSTLPYLDNIISVINALQAKHDFTFLVIADKNPELPLKSFQFVPWNAATEIEDLLRMDIGIMPLKADAWSEGKCGFKLIQYLSLAIPALASPVGVNSVIIQQGENGYLCNSEEEWKNHLEELIANTSKRKQMGEVGQQLILKNYSTQSQHTTFLQLFS